jgi:hypothetical protein
MISSSGGLAHIGENIFDHLDVETFANCHLVCKSWQHFIVNTTNGQLWKRKYLQKLAKPGTHAHGLIKTNLNLFLFNQGIIRVHGVRGVTPPLENFRAIYPPP